MGEDQGQERARYRGLGSHREQERGSGFNGTEANGQSSGVGVRSRGELIEGRQGVFLSMRERWPQASEDLGSKEEL